MLIGLLTALFKASIVTSTVMHKNRQLSILKQETIGSIFNWDLSQCTLIPQSLCTKKI